MRVFTSKLDKIAMDAGPLILRILLGVAFIAHGSQKLFGAFGGHGIAGTVSMTQSLGLPAPVFFAWLVALVEFLGGLAMLGGLFTRLAAFALAIDMLVAIAKVHFKNGFFLPMGFEYPLALMAIAITLMITGPGRISLDWLARRMFDRKQ